MKKAGPFKYRKVNMLKAGTNHINTRYYLFTNKGVFWAPPFDGQFLTFETEIDNDIKLLNAFAVLLDTGEAAKLHIGNDIYYKKGETIAFAFRIPIVPRKFSGSAEGRKSDARLRRSSGQHRSGVRWVQGQDGALALRGMVGNARVADGPKCGHSVAELQRRPRSDGQTLPVRSSEDSNADSPD